MPGPVRAAVLLAALLAAPLPAAAAEPVGLDPAKPLTAYRLDTWTTDEGLPQNMVTAVAQTRDGYVWVGGYDGLARFNGISFTVFRARQTPGLKSNAVRVLCEDTAGALWIGTSGGGVTRYQGGRFETFTRRDGLPDDVVWALAADAAGGIWVGTHGGGVARYRSGAFEVVVASGPPVYALRQDRAGNLWVCTHAGLRRRAPDGTWTDYTTAQGLPGNVVSAVTEDAAGRIWVGTLGAGLALLQAGRVTRFTAADGLPSGVVRAVQGDPRGGVFVATSGGLARFEGGRFASLTTHTGLRDDSLYALASDAYGALWVGSGGGLVRVRDASVASYTRAEGLPHDHVHALLEDRAGTIWAGTTEGLARKDGDRFMRVPLGVEPPPVVRGLAQDPSGALWVASYGAGLFRLQDGRVTRFTRADGLVSDSLRSVLADRSGRIFAATVDGLCVRNGTRWRGYHKSDGLGADSLISLHEDASGDVWIGTDGGGVTRFPRAGETGFQTWNESQGLPSNFVLAFASGRTGALWVGTNAGLARLHEGKLQSWTASDGLESDSISQLVETDDALWLGTKRGVLRLAHSALQTPGMRLRADSYDRADGMRASECSTPAQPPGLRARDGRLWFATPKGIAVIDPRQLPPVPQPPPIAIERVLADGAERDPTQPLVLAPGTQRLEVHYTGLSLLPAQRIRYRFRLAGYEQDFVDAEARTLAAYTSLPPGRYQFEVQARDGLSAWSPRPATLAIEIRPTLFQTTWFRAGALLAALLLGFGGHGLRLRALQARSRQLAALVDERTRSLRAAKDEAEHQRALAEDADRLKTELLGIAAHDLKNPLSVVMVFAEMIESQPLGRDKLIDLSARIGSAARRMLALIEDLLTTAALDGGQVAVHVAATDLSALVGSAAPDYHASAARKQQALVIDCEPGLWVMCDPERLRQALDNLVGNAFKFSPAGATVWLGVHAASERVRVAVRDAGPGLAAADLPRLFGKFTRLSARPTGGETSTGLGLSIVKRLVELQGGTVTAHSDGPGHGATFTIELPRASQPAAGSEIIEER